MTWLGALNFLVLQWFGVRLGRVMATRQTDHRIVGTVLVPWGGASLVGKANLGSSVQIGWKLLRWIVPLTGWWSSYRWIGKRR